MQFPITTVYEYSNTYCFMFFKAKRAELSTTFENYFTYLEWSFAPPRSSGETYSPVAAFTRGGPARNKVPILSIITASSAMVGT